MAALAAHLAVSREHLSRTVRRHLGLDLRSFLRRERLRAAQRLLSDGAAVKAAARAAGFASLSAFSRAFASEHGRSPASWARTRG